MRKLALLVILSLAFSFSVCAQNTNVSGTVTDSGGQAWVLGTYEFDFVPSPRFQGQYKQNGVNFNPVPISGTLDATASFSTIPVPDNLTITPSGTQWSVTICPQATTKCFTSVPIVITGVSQTITSSLIPPAIVMSCGASQKGYADSEVLCQQGGYYYNLLSNTLRLCKVSTPLNTCNTWIDAGSGAAAAAGLPPQTQVNDPGNPGHFGGTACESFPSLTVGPANVDCDWHSKGPNPYTDVTRFGVRALAQLSTPAIPGITGNINSGSTSLTVSTSTCLGQSGSTCFINGDGITVFGAGTAHSMTTPGAPTVTPSIAAAPTGTRIVVNGLTGATTYNYQIIARNKTGGLTAASVVGTTTTGAANLGSQSVALTSCSRASATVTCITSSAHGLTVGTMAFIRQTVGDGTFSGWYIVATVPDNTHFTYTSGFDTRAGASVSSTGGTVFWWNCNHLTWTAVSGAFIYYIYGRTGGSLTLIGQSWPDNSVAGVTDGALSWDDFGATMMGNYSAPYYIPTTPPGAATSNNLTTTVSAGAGTTSLTLTASASTGVAGATVLFDNAPNILTAANASAQAPLMFPFAANPYVVNSYLQMPAGTNSICGGNLYLNDTVQIISGNRWSGTCQVVNGPAQSFAWEGFTSLTVARASPGVYLSLGSFSIKNLNFTSAVTNNALLALLDATGVPSGTMESVNFSTTPGGVGDYMGMALVFRSIVSNSISNVTLRGNIGFTGGAGDGTNGSTATPLVYGDFAEFVAENISMNSRGIAFRSGSGGVGLAVDDYYMNGGITPPFFMLPATNLSQTLKITKRAIEDTVPHSFVSNLSSGGGTLYLPDEFTGPANDPTSNPPVVSGFSTAVTGLVTSTNYTRADRNTISGVALDGVFNPGNTGAYKTLYASSGVAVNPAYSLFIDGAPVVNLAGVIAAGGSVPVGAHTYQIVPLWQNGGEGEYSNKISVTTTTGNQTVNLTWTSVPGNCKGYDVYRDSVLLLGVFPNISGCAISSFSDTNLSNVGASIGTVPAGGPTMLMPGVQGIATPALTMNGFPVSGPFASGAMIVTNYQNSSYDNFNRANGAIGANWTNQTNGFNVASNTVVGSTASVHNTAFFSANTFGINQFAQATITALNGTDVNGPAVLASGTGASADQYSCDENTTTLRIDKELNGSVTILTSVAGTGAVGDVLRAELTQSGGVNTITCFQNGVQTLQTTDSSFLTGSPGIHTFGNVVTMDNWSGGNLHPIAQLDTEQDWTQPQHFTKPVTIGSTNPTPATLALGVYSPRYTITGGAAPTCTVTGAGTGATCTLSSFSTDNSGAMQINSGTAPGSSGTWTLTFSAGFPNAAFCTVGPGSGGTVLNARATVFDNTNGTLGVHAGVWDNNAVAINASQAITFIISYICGGH